ncbi:MAG TPA: hypothetical protein VLM38_22710 [Blastocatellia bacterium]|nr:hypothetical protein [Blastocatellia bacterium]
MNRITVRLLALAAIAAINVVGSSQVLAQGGCSLTEADAPAVRGVRLGMSAEQLLALFPASTKRKEIKDALVKAKAADSEPVYLAFEPADGNKERFDGVGGFSAGLYKGRVIEVNIQYVGPDWKSIDEWIAKLSETLKLPGGEAWRVGPNESPNKVLSCRGVEIEAAIQGGGGSIRMRNTDYQKSAEERTRAGEENKKRDYKP